VPVRVKIAGYTFVFVFITNNINDFINSTSDVTTMF
jgi:hypothetical protein